MLHVSSIQIAAKALSLAYMTHSSISWALRIVYAVLKLWCTLKVYVTYRCHYTTSVPSQKICYYLWQVAVVYKQRREWCHAIVAAVSTDWALLYSWMYLLVTRDAAVIYYSESTRCVYSIQWQVCAACASGGTKLDYMYQYVSLTSCDLKPAPTTRCASLGQLCVCCSYVHIYKVYT